MNRIISSCNIDKYFPSEIFKNEVLGGVGVDVENEDDLDNNNNNSSLYDDKKEEMEDKDICASVAEAVVLQEKLNVNIYICIHMCVYI